MLNSTMQRPAISGILGFSVCKNLNMELFPSFLHKHFYTMASHIDTTLNNFPGRNVEPLRAGRMSVCWRVYGTAYSPITVQLLFNKENNRDSPLLVCLFTD